MRPPFVDFPDDPGAWATDDAFMLGPDLLVAPVLEPGVSSRAVRLPTGARWRELATGLVHEGGEVVEPVVGRQRGVKQVGHRVHLLPGGHVVVEGRDACRS